MNAVVFPDIVIPGTLRIAQLGFRNGYHIRGPVSRQGHMGEGCLPDFRAFHIRIGIGITDQRMRMRFQSAGVAAVRMLVVFPTLAGLLLQLKAGIVVDMDRCFRFRAGKNRLRRFRRLRLAFFQTTVQNGLPL